MRKFHFLSNTPAKKRPSKQPTLSCVVLFSFLKWRSCFFLFLIICITIYHKYDTSQITFVNSNDNDIGKFLYHNILFLNSCTIGIPLQWCYLETRLGFEVFRIEIYVLSFYLRFKNFCLCLRNKIKLLLTSKPCYNIIWIS